MQKVFRCTGVSQVWDDDNSPSSFFRYQFTREESIGFNQRKRSEDLTLLDRQGAKYKVGDRLVVEISRAK